MELHDSQSDWEFAQIDNLIKFPLEMEIRAQVGKSFRYTLERDYRIVEGELPPGIRFDSEIGLLFGRPSKEGTYSFTLKRKCKKIALVIIVEKARKKKQKCDQLVLVDTPSVKFCLSPARIIFEALFEGDIKAYLDTSEIITSVSPSLVETKSSLITAPVGNNTAIQYTTFYTAATLGSVSYTITIKSGGCTSYTQTFTGVFAGCLG